MVCFGWRSSDYAECIMTKMPISVFMWTSGGNSEAHFVVLNWEILSHTVSMVIMVVVALVVIMMMPIFFLEIVELG